MQSDACHLLGRKTCEKGKAHQVVVSSGGCLQASLPSRKWTDRHRGESIDCLHAVRDARLVHLLISTYVVPMYVQHIYVPTEYREGLPVRVDKGIQC